jgi:hypothetical protein
VIPSITLQKLTHALVQQESTLGKYNHAVGQAYQMIGSFYLFHLHNPSKAVVMLREGHRIDMILYGTTTAGAFSPHFKTALEKKGIPEAVFQNIQGSIGDSVRLELGGDMLRQFGLYEKSAKEYQKAIKAEEAAFGRENPTLAILWRKLACLGAMIENIRDSCKGMTDEIDKISGKWLCGHTMSPNQQELPKHEKLARFIQPKLSNAIQKGDRHYKLMNFHHAVSAYSHATRMAVRRRSRSTSRSRSTRSSRRRSRSKSVDASVKNNSGQGHVQEPKDEPATFLKEPSSLKSSFHQTVVSTSKRSRRGKPSSSARASLYQVAKQSVEPERPKSDSHVAKLAKRMAKQTTKQLQKTMASGSSHSVAKFLSGGYRGNKDVEVEEFGSSKPKSEAYATLASPPMTPLIDNTALSGKIASGGLGQIGFLDTLGGEDALFNLPRQ